MFTGLIRELAHVVRYDTTLLTLRSTYRPCIGDSIAINGVCLTVVSLEAGIFSVELSQETRELIAIENLKDTVHMEPALCVGDKLDGHMVQGHVDCLGIIKSMTKKSNGLDVIIHIPEAFIRFVIPKGSIAIDGVSLTVNNVEKETFRLTIIPHTLSQTLIQTYKIGRRVNIETDMFARYIYHMFKDNQPLDWNSVDRILASY
ncbi:MAG: riboflavin synthase [Sulfurospirillaceae bacterium]|nr:riboflavin synthase [Sulfurospirillaceae bacterium]MDD2826292.1 riboflavin synthase [Sulfurospirillaceae bacterium]